MTPGSKVRHIDPGEPYLSVLVLLGTPVCVDVSVFTRGATPVPQLMGVGSRGNVPNPRLGPMLSGVGVRWDEEGGAAGGGGG